MKSWKLVLRLSLLFIVSTSGVKVDSIQFNSSPLKMDGWNTILSYWGPGLFSGAFAVSFREGTLKYGSLEKGL